MCIAVQHVIKQLGLGDQITLICISEDLCRPGRGQPVQLGMQGLVLQRCDAGRLGLRDVRRAQGVAVLVDESHG